MHKDIANTRKNKNINDQQKSTALERSVKYFSGGLKVDHILTQILISSCTNEACLGVLEIQDISHFTSRDIGYYPFYFPGYGILCSIFELISGILNI